MVDEVIDHTLFPRLKTAPGLSVGHAALATSYPLTAPQTGPSNTVLGRMSLSPLFCTSPPKPRVADPVNSSLDP